MNIKMKKLRIVTRGILAILIAVTMTVTVPSFRTEARASEGAAFLGGMVAGHIVGGAIRRDKVRTAAAVESASQPRAQTVYVQEKPVSGTTAPAPSAKMTPEQKIQQLDKLAAGGYITPEEYKAKKKAILDSL